MTKIPTTRLRYFLIIIISFTLAIFWITPAQAVEFDDDGRVEAGEVIDDDLFISNSNVTIDGQVNGTVFINSATAVVNGVVEGDLFINSASAVFNGEVTGNLVFVGQRLDVTGQVAGSLFTAGATLTLAPTAVVARNLYNACYSLETQPGAVIERDMLSACYQIIHGGTLQRDMKTSSAALEINGEVGRDVIAEVEQPGSTTAPFNVFLENAPEPLEPGLRVSPGAHILGTLSYSSPVAQENAILSKPGGGAIYTYKASEEDSQETHADLARRTLNQFLTLVILALLATLTYGKQMVRCSENKLPYLPTTGRGLVILIAGTAAIFTLAAASVTLGILLGVVTLNTLSAIVTFGGLATTSALAVAFFTLVFYISKLVVAARLGRAILLRTAPTFTGSVFWPTLIGLVLYILLAPIPVLGWLLTILVILYGSGVLWQTHRRRGTEESISAVLPDALEA